MQKLTRPPDRRKRRRSANDSYVLPRDVLEGNRLDLQHHILREALQGDYVSPVEDPSYILDVGSGTGVWGSQAALDFPEAEVVDFDVEPPERTVLSASIGPVRSSLNHHFVQGNVISGLPFPDSLFDFTHQRMVLAPAVPSVDWENVIRELIRVTRPGGWVELLEPGAVFQNAGPATTKLIGWGMELGGHRGLGFKSIEELGTVAEQAGLREVHVRIFHLPLGDWDPYTGVLLAKDYMSIMEAVEPVVCRALDIPVATYDEALMAAPIEWKDNHVSAPFAVVHGQA